MSDSQQYTLRWRGKEIGPYSIEVVNHKLDDHELGMGHEILAGDEWITLEEFFGRLKRGTPAAAQSEGTPNPGAVESTRGRIVAPAQLPVPQGGAQPPIVSSSGVRLPGMTPVPQQTLSEAKHDPAGAAIARSDEPPIADANPTPRRRLIYALLAILFGFAGLHNYYARHWLTGLLQLLLSVATFLLGFGIIAAWLWAVLEAVLVRKDGNGLQMK